MAVVNEIVNEITGKFPVRVVAAVLCILVFLAQALTLDYYLVAEKGNLWWLWTIADAAVLAMFIVAFVMSFRFLKTCEATETDVCPPKKREGELPLGYLVWLLYSICTAIKVAIIFEDIAWQLDESEFFGPNTLKIVVVSSGVVFLLLVTTHNNASINSLRYAFINTLIHGVLFNIFDTVNILDILFIQESHIFLTFSLHRIINGIGCLNIIVPFIPLLVLSRTRYGRDKLTSKVHAVHAFVYLCSINLPLFIIRMYLWHALDKDVSVFLMKNILGIIFALIDIWRSCLMPKPKTDVGVEEGHELRENAHRKPADSEGEGETIF